MSIRLRLTLFYSLILGLVLFMFSFAVYRVQLLSAGSTLERVLVEEAQRVIRGRRVALSEGERRPPVPREVLAPKQFRSGAFAFQLRSLGGEVVAYPENHPILPLSEAGLRETLAGNPWTETMVVEGERFVIYSEPVIVHDQVREIVQIAHSLADQDRYLDQLRRILLMSSGVTTLIAFGIGWALAGLALRPIQRITQTAVDIGAERDFSRRVRHVGPNDEVGQLARTFNAMLTELGDAYGQVEEALQQQRRFVADVSHELRTPLTTVRGNIELLRRRPPIAPQDAEDVLADVAVETERLIRLVNDLLALAHAEARHSASSAPIPIAPLVQEVCRQAHSLAPGRSIACEESPDLVALADPDGLRQVLLILLDNAIKHTGGPITVATRRLEAPQGARPASRSVSDAYVAIHVRDTGPGMGPEALQHIFERFYRGEAAKAQPGMGLGLPIAKALAEAQGGTITVESAPERGSVFTITLPAA